MTNNWEKSSKAMQLRIYVPYFCICAITVLVSVMKRSDESEGAGYKIRDL